MKIGFIFAGQGAQKVGMGKSFYTHFDVSKHIFDRAGLALGYDLKKICFEGTQEALNQTEITQPAILTTSIAMLKAFESLTHIKPTAVAGLSLGEYSAHVCSGTFAFTDAVQLVQKRGKYMQEAVPSGIGGMLALTGASSDQIEKLISHSASKGHIQISNYNSPKQMVLGGEMTALKHAMEISSELGIRRSMLLPVSAPFHTSMLKNAELQLAEALQEVAIHSPQIPVISNVEGKMISNSQDVMPSLATQVTSSVQWVKCIEEMKKLGIDTLIEFGPGKALSAFVSKIDRSLKVLSIDEYEDLLHAIEWIHSQDKYNQAI